LRQRDFRSHEQRLFRIAVGGAEIALAALYIYVVILAVATLKELGII